jgi:excisionase family DNA binding protein
MGTEILSAAEVAARLGVSVRRVQQMVKNGQLPATVFGGALMIHVKDLARVDARKLGRPDKETLIIRAEFDEFARQSGYEAEKGIAIFEQDEQAARRFYTEARSAGFDVVLDFNQAGSYRGTDDLSKLPKYWFVRIESL